MSIAASETRVEPTTMTVEEFLALPDDGVDRELIEGVVRIRGMTIRNRFHARSESRVAHLLWSWLETRPEPRGEIISGEGGFRLKATKATLVGIDVVYVSAELLAATDPKRKIYDGPPTLAVEVLSPSDPHEDVVEKVNSTSKSARSSGSSTPTSAP